MQRKEQIGVSIYPEVILGKAKSRMQQLLADFACADDILPWLAGLGVDSVELRMLNGKLSPQEYVCFLEKVWKAGMQVTIHGVMPQEAPEQYVALYHRVLQMVCDRQRKTVFTVHSLHGRDETRTALCALSQALRAYPGIRLSLENQRIKDDVHPHYSMGGVAQNAAACDAGLTWDMGHYAYNVQKELYVLPASDLLRRVIHTHIHSINAEGCTHHFLTEQPVRMYIENLRACGYEGIYNIELFSNTYPETVSPRKTLEEAVCLLNSMLK